MHDLHRIELAEAIQNRGLASRFNTEKRRRSNRRSRGTAWPGRIARDDALTLQTFDSRLYRRPRKPQEPGEICSGTAGIFA